MDFGYLSKSIYIDPQLILFHCRIAFPNMIVHNLLNDLLLIGTLVVPHFLPIKCYCNKQSYPYSLVSV